MKRIFTLLIIFCFSSQISFAQTYDGFGFAASSSYEYAAWNTYGTYVTTAEKSNGTWDFSTIDTTYFANKAGHFDSSFDYCSTPIGTVTNITNGTKTVTSKGQLKLFGYTFQNAIRVRSDQYEYDDIYRTGYDRDNTKWYIRGISTPVLEVENYISFAPHISAQTRTRKVYVNKLILDSALTIDGQYSQVSKRDTVAVCAATYDYNGNTYTATQEVTAIHCSGQYVDSTHTRFIDFTTIKSLKIIDTCKIITINGNLIGGIITVSDTTKTAAGCDSIQTTTYRVSTSSRIETRYFCDTYQYNGQSYSSALSFNDTITSGACDSINTINYVQLQKSQKDTTISICGPTMYKGILVHKDTTFVDTLIGSNGCDSIYNQLLVISPITASQIVDTCKIVSPAYQIDTLKTSAGCDSIHTVTYNFTLKSQAEDRNFCDTYLYKGVSYSSANTFKDTISTLHCDSIITINYVQLQKSQKDTTINMCLPKVFNGVLIQRDTVIVETNTGVNGCDSTYTSNFIFPKTPGTWKQIGADIDGEAIDDYSGRSVSLSADGFTVAVGAYGNDGNGSYAGHVRVYKNENGAWQQVGADIDGEAAQDYFGYSVSLSADGSIVAAGAYRNSGNGSYAGHVRVYKNENGTWQQVGSDIDGEAANDYSGYSICLSSDGSTVAVGAYSNDGNGSNAGHVKIYKNVSGVWQQLGSNIDGEASGDESGKAVSLSSDGSIVAIGAPSNDGNVNNSGHVRVYKNENGLWQQVGSDIDGEVYNDYSGISVSLSPDGSTVAIGSAVNDGNGGSSGHVRVYKNENGVWQQMGADLDGEAPSDRSGISVSLSATGSKVAIGAYNNDGNGSDAGHVRIYQYKNGVWQQLGADIDGEAANDFSGYSVSMDSDGSKVAIGAFYNDANGWDAGQVRVFSLLGCSNFSVSVSQTGDSLESQVQGDCYQWLKCPAMTEISGAHNRLFQPSESGSYCAVVSKEGCVDTSDCVSYITTSVDDFTAINMQVYPNPTKGNFKVDLGKQQSAITVFVTDLVGKVIYSGAYNNVSTVDLSIPGTRGIYNVVVVTGNERAVTKIVKE